MCSVDESLVLAASDFKATGRERLRNRNLTTRPFGPILLATFGAHRKAAGWHDYHFRTVITLLKATTN
jgi:hypothetical protein